MGCIRALGSNDFLSSRSDSEQYQSANKRICCILSTVAYFDLNKSPPLLVFENYSEPISIR